MLLDKILPYCTDLTKSAETQKEYQNYFLFPYYLHIEDQVKTILSNFELCSKFYKDIAFQIVDYTYNNYFKFIYPFEYNLAKKNKLFQENDISNDFISNISCQQIWIKYLFNKYPILHNLLTSYSKQVLSYVSEIATNYTKDSDALRNTLGIPINELKSIKLFKGDLHNGRCVCSLEFENDCIVYYKPRNANNEEFIIAMIKSLKKYGLDIKLGIPPFLNRQTYSWHMHIKNEECRSFNPSQYYHNLGRLQGLFYLLGTQDIIPDNVVFNNGIPYLIDCESIVLRPYIYKNGNVLSTYLQKSVLKTGILPDWMFDNSKQRTSISSVLFCFRQNTHLPKTAKGLHPMMRKDMDDFISGFRFTYNYISNHTQIILELLKTNRVNDLYSRVLLHPTMIYSCLLKEQITPEYLSTTKTLQPLLASLLRKETYGSHAIPFTKSIQKQIESGNIPYFTSSGKHTWLYTNYTDVICRKFYTFSTNEEWLINKLSSFSHKDFLYQRNIIEETLNFYFDIIEPEVKSSETDIIHNNKSNTPSSYLQTALEIYQRIGKQEVVLNNRIGYVGRTKCLYDGAFQIGLHNNSIYDGLAGLCIFYMTLYKQTKDIELFHKATSIFNQIQNDVHKINISEDDLSTIPISPLTGITGILYLMECFPNELYQKSTYSLIIKILRKIIPLTEQYDYMSGLTGLICFLYQSNLLKMKEKQELLNLCGMRLLELSSLSEGMMSWSYLDGAKYTERQSMVLGGYSHGSSSISVAFYMLYLATSASDYLEAFQMTLKHDRSLFSCEINGWIDNRNLNTKHDSGSWCHGSAGIALSRLQLLSLGYNDSTIQKELSIAISQIKKRLHCNLSICHGVMGNLEILHILKKAGYVVSEDLSFISESICNSINSCAKILCGDDNYNSLIGLFMGISGIGYQLIRFSFWEKTPSILCLEIGTRNRIFH